MTATTITTTATTLAWADEMEINPYHSGHDFAIGTINGWLHWRGLGRFEQYYSERGFASIDACLADAIYSLCRLDSKDDSAASTLVFELGLPSVSSETRGTSFPHVA